MKQILVLNVSEDGMTLILNVGSADGVTPGKRVLVYSEGPELHDPITKESLGRLEIVRGTGKATHVQEKLTTVRSDSLSEVTRTIRKKRHQDPYYHASALSVLSGYFNTPEEIEEVMPKECLPFDGAKQGDKCRFI